MSAKTRRLPATRDARWRSLAITVIAIAVGGVLLAFLSEGHLPDWRLFSPGALSGVAGRDVERIRVEIHERFQQGVVMLHARQYEHALTALHRVLILDPKMPEAHVNMGFALVGLERHGAARDFFESAIALRGEQANAYYGLALALEGMHDRRGAIGAMRTFLHLCKSDDPYQRKALAALWEWESARDGAGSTAGRVTPPQAGR